MSVTQHLTQYLMVTILICMLMTKLFVVEFFHIGDGRYMICCISYAMLVTKNGPIAHHDHISSTTSVNNICCQKYNMFNQNICCSEWLTCEIVITKAKICPITQNGTMIIVGIERSWSISITQSDLFMIYHVLRFMKLITCQKNIICSYIPML